MAENYIDNDLEVHREPIPPMSTTAFQSCFKKQIKEA
jgi:hypothetical protein